MSTQLTSKPAWGALLIEEGGVASPELQAFIDELEVVVGLLSDTSTGGSGDVTGPASSTDNALARFDSTTGKTLQNSVGVLDDSGNLSGLGNISLSGTVDGIDIAVDVAANTAKVTNATHTGDVSGSVALTIGNDKVLTVHILDANVTLAKMADIATASLLGRNTAGTGVPEVLSKATALSLLNVEDGADVTDTTNVTAAGALMDSEVTSLAAIKDVILTSGLTISANWETADDTKLSGIEALADVTDETNVVSSLDGATLTAATVVGGDKILGQDVSDSDNIKTYTAQSIANLAPGGSSWAHTGSVDITQGGTSPTSTTLFSSLTGVSQLIMHFKALSTNSANTPPLIQLGDSGGYHVTGYDGNASFLASGANASEVNSTGFLLTAAARWDAADAGTGRIFLNHMGSNIWSIFSDFEYDATGNGVSLRCHGTVTLTTELTQVQVTTIAGTATFDSGTMLGNSI